jgi:hypothetical protein
VAAYDRIAVNASSRVRHLASQFDPQETAMRISTTPSPAAALPTAAKPGRSPHTPATKASAASAIPAATPAKAGGKTATPAVAAAAAAAPETYAGAGSLLDTHA